jgi:protein KRI1
VPPPSLPLQVAGGGMPPSQLLDKLLEGEFDPDEYDRQMAAMFDDSYYEVGGRAGRAVGAGARDAP